MNFLDFKKEVDAGNLKRFYVFTGEETKLMQMYLGRINLPKVSANSFKEIIGEIGTSGLFHMTKVYVIRNDKDALELGVEAINNYIMKTKTHHIIIMIYDNPDGRLKFFKDAKPFLYEFTKLTIEQSSKIIQKELKEEGIDPYCAAILAKRCGADLSRMLLECDKLRMLGKPITEDLINDLTFMEPEDAIFAMIDCIAKKDLSKAFGYYKDLQRLNESPVKIVTLMYNNFRTLLIVQNMKDIPSSDIASKTGLNTWIVGKTKDLCGRFTLNELVSILRLLQATDVSIKKGMIDIDMSVDYVLNSFAYIGSK